MSSAHVIKSSSGAFWAESTGTYLSFVGVGGFLGACFIAKRGVRAALHESWALGINPGGEVAATPVMEMPPAKWVGRLLSRDDIAEMDAELREAPASAIRPDILAAVERAMDAADAKHGAGSMGRPFLAEHARVAVLTEELGEVARAVLDGDLDGLRHELEQLAGCALGWLGVLP